MKIAICEDTIEDMSLIRAVLSETIEKLRLDISADFYGSGEELLASVKNGTSYPFIILDIYMKTLNGIEAARKVREILPDVQLAFLTTSKEFMLDAFDLGALHYLIKPVTTEALGECLTRFGDRVHLPMSMLEIKSDIKTYTFPLAHVQRILSSNKGIDVYLQNNDRPFHIPVSFTRAETQLDQSYFIRISRGYIVQMSFILCIDGDVCRLKDGTEVLISRREKAAIRTRYNDYLFRR